MTLGPRGFEGRSSSSSSSSTTTTRTSSTRIASYQTTSARGGVPTAPGPPPPAARGDEVPCSPSGGGARRPCSPRCRRRRTFDVCTASWSGGVLRGDSTRGIPRRRRGRNIDSARMGTSIGRRPCRCPCRHRRPIGRRPRRCPCCRHSRRRHRCHCRHCRHPHRWQVDTVASFGLTLPDPLLRFLFCTASSHALALADLLGLTLRISLVREDMSLAFAGTGPRSARGRA